MDEKKEHGYWYRYINKERDARHFAQQKASKYGLTENFSTKEWRELKNKYWYACLWCNRKEPNIVLSPDHIIPFGWKGKNTIDNIQPLCKECNGIKGGMPLDLRSLYIEE